MTALIDPRTRYATPPFDQQPPIEMPGSSGAMEPAPDHGECGYVVRVNAVAPGPVWTPFIPGSTPPEKVESFGTSTLFGRPAQPVELAPLYVWLASTEAS